MKNILNTLFYFLKFLLLVSAFSLTLFIMIQMYQRLEKNFLESYRVFLPYLVIFVLFIVNIFARQTTVSKNLFYNITCFISFLTIIVVCLRAILDGNMILREQLGKNINFNFFDDFISYMKLMLYGLSIANIFLMFSSKKETKEKVK